MIIYQPKLNIKYVSDFLYKSLLRIYILKILEIDTWQHREEINRLYNITYK